MKCTRCNIEILPTDQQLDQTCNTCYRAWQECDGMKKYSLKTDHTAIKKQIKEWEILLDKIIHDRYRHITTPKETLDILGNISDEMMAINI